MKRDAYLHDVDLGSEVTTEELKELLQSQKDTPLVRGLLQCIRHEVAALQREALDRPPISPQEREYRAGEGKALEEHFWDLVAFSQGRSEE